LQYGRDTYGYVWPRDGAFISMALDKAGYDDISRRFYGFFGDVITDAGYLLHKYQPDKSLGSSWHPWIKGESKQLAIQEDETAIILVGLWEHYKYTKDLEFIEGIYNSFIKKATEFISSFIEPSTGLPAQSYDLWEEKLGISTFTSCTVYGALVAAGNFAYLLGKEDDKKKYLDQAEKIKEAILKFLWNEKDGYFYKDIVVDNGVVKPNLVFDASSFFGVYRFGLLLPSDPILVKAYETAKENLSKIVPIGGVVRYKGDKYFEAYEGSLGNPWFITTLWFIQYDIAKAETEKELVDINSKLLWIVEKALASGILSEQINPNTGEQLSVAPLTWSHAEFVMTVMDYMEKLERMGVRKMTFPIVEY
jgi:GH15 family glucan-1,4-alpha-glucosidase